MSSWILALKVGSWPKTIAFWLAVIPAGYVIIRETFLIMDNVTATDEILSLWLSASGILLLNAAVRFLVVWFILSAFVWVIDLFAGFAKKLGW